MYFIVCSQAQLYLPRFFSDVDTFIGASFVHTPILVG